MSYLKSELTNRKDWGNNICKIVEPVCARISMCSVHTSGTKTKVKDPAFMESVHVFVLPLLTLGQMIK
jgi:hypothetical protein